MHTYFFVISCIRSDPVETYLFDTFITFFYIHLLFFRYKYNQGCTSSTSWARCTWRKFGTFNKRNYSSTSRGTNKSSSDALWIWCESSWSNGRFYTIGSTRNYERGVSKNRYVLVVNMGLVVMVVVVMFVVGFEDWQVCFLFCFFPFSFPLVLVFFFVHNRRRSRWTCIY